MTPAQRQRRLADAHRRVAREHRLPLKPCGTIGLMEKARAAYDAELARGSTRRAAFQAAMEVWTKTKP